MADIRIRVLFQLSRHDMLFPMNLRTIFNVNGFVGHARQSILHVLFFCSAILLPFTVQAAGAPAPVPVTPAVCGSCVRFNDFNTLVRDGKIARSLAKTEMKRLLDEVRSDYYAGGGTDFPKGSWVFPLAGYDYHAITGGRYMGYISYGYDYFSGNRHGGHPSFDIFIRDRNQDGRDDKSGAPVKVLSLTGGIVVALEREWQPGSRLRGGKYLWIYDPANQLLVYYAHNAELYVGLGDRVKPGDLLAIVGRSGYNAFKHRSPSHLHLTVLQVRDGHPVPLNIYRDLTRVRTSAGQ